MKKILFACCFFLVVQEVSASHIVGGELSYQYIGDTSGIPHQYIINLTLFRRNETGSAPLYATESLVISSSCYGSTSVTLNRVAPPGSIPAGDGGYVLPRPVKCADTTASNYFKISGHRYVATVVLPGPCSDFLFSKSICCKSAAIDNITNPASSNFYFEGKLNNLFGPNNSVPFEHFPVADFCIGQQAFAHFGARDVEGDSVYYFLTAPNSAMGVHNIYTSGYSQQQPITTTTGVVMDSVSGILTFSPAQVEVDIVKVKASEYRYNPQDSLWKLTGVTAREIVAIITPNCIPQANNWAWDTDSLSLDTTAAIPCNDSLIKLNTSIEVNVGSIASDGSDFRVTDGRGVVVPILKAEAANATLGNLVTKEIWLTANHPFTYKDTLSLDIKTGTDGNSLTNACGTDLPLTSGILLAVTSCNGYFHLEEAKAHKLTSGYPNPVKNVLNLKFAKKISGPLRIETYSALGKLMASETFDANLSGNFQADCNSLKPGLYFIKISTHEGYSETISIIKN